MARTTRINDWSNETSDELESISPSVDSVVPRDTSSSTEKYIIFMKKHQNLTESEIDEIESRGFVVRSAINHSVDYENKETNRVAEYVLL